MVKFAGQYDVRMTLRGESGDSSERSPAASRAVYSALPVPPPLPA
jgi:hypothetical protein